jgi:hypothetical protein
MLSRAAPIDSSPVPAKRFVTRPAGASPASIVSTSSPREIADFRIDAGALVVDDEAAAHLRVLALERPHDVDGGIGFALHPEDELEPRVVLLEERAEVGLEPGVRAAEGFQDRHRRQLHDATPFETGAA